MTNILNEEVNEFGEHKGFTAFRYLPPTISDAIKSAVECGATRIVGFS